MLRDSQLRVAAGHTVVSAADSSDCVRPSLRSQMDVEMIEKVEFERLT